MPRIPITVMGYRCERCEYEWIPRDFDRDPLTCPKCRSPYWDRPRERMPYEEFKEKIESALSEAGKPLTWTEIRTAKGLPQKFPNNRWVRRLEEDINMKRERDKGGMIHWQLA